VLAERTGGKPVRVHLAKLSEGIVRTDPDGRTFLIEPMEGGGQKHTFLWKYRDGRILLDDDNAALAGNLTPGNDQSEALASTATDLDELEFPPITSTEEDGNDTPWIMQAS
jgi:hypothetical protein